MEGRQTIGTLRAGETSAKTLVELFTLSLSNGRKGKPWALKHDSLKVPTNLVKNLGNVMRAQYDPDCEATCRIKIDLMLIECRLAFLKIVNASDKAAKVSAPTTFPSIPMFSLPVAQVDPGSPAARGFTTSAPAEHSLPMLGGESQAIGDVTAVSSSASGEVTPAQCSKRAGPGRA
ncbi:hypothetical protein BDD12DRAFT_802798 [Trichophaea hybrida]|nr:hypothetical protein BDD12DRAFT_802798 [Trichophaea hybrida]